MTIRISTLETVNARRIQARRERAQSGKKLSWWQPIVVFVVLIGVWYAVAAFYASQQLAFLVPYPHLVFQAMFLDPIVQPAIVQALARSTGVALTGLGFAIVLGVIWAVLMAQAKWVENALYPYAVILQCIPILALVPLIGALFGYEFNSRVIVTVMISLFPMVSNTLFGLHAVDKGQRELFKLQGANNWITLTKLQFPAALPSIFVGLRTAAGLSVIGAIVGDQFFQRGTPGLGVLIQVYASRLQGSALFATIITASLLGVAVFLLFGLIGRLAVGRWYDFS